MQVKPQETRFARDIQLTYSCKSIYPFGNSVSGQLVTYILTEMVAVLGNQMICVTIVVCRLAFHELSKLDRIQACCAQKDWLPKLETRALSRVHFKDTTCWVIMGSKGIFHTMNCKHTKETRSYIQSKVQQAIGIINSLNFVLRKST